MIHKQNWLILQLYSLCENLRLKRGFDSVFLIF